MIRATTAYAIQIMVAVAKSEGVISSSTISEQTGISQISLKKIATCLKNAGLIRSQQGLHGGYSLSRPAEKITMLEVLRSVEPEDGALILPGTDDKTGNTEAGALVRQMFGQINDKLNSYFEAVKLSELIGDSIERKPQ